jgi:hypothetical protein
VSSCLTGTGRLRGSPHSTCRSCSAQGSGSAPRRDDRRHAGLGPHARTDLGDGGAGIAPEAERALLDASRERE